jgi:Penicillin amidase
MKGASQIAFTFNWFYVDDRDTGYYVSGLDPVRPSNVDPSLPTWGDGRSEWQGFLPAEAHVHQVNPAQGYFVSWNNKPAPGFAAADDQYGYGQVFRSVLLTRQLTQRMAAGPVTRAQVVQAMETAATQDLDGVTVLPLLLDVLGSRPEPAGVTAMLDQLRSWIADGAHRLKAKQGDAQYAHAAAVAIADELMPNLIRALYDPILAAGGVGAVGSTGGAVTNGYAVLPMQWVNTPNSGGAHLGSSYDGGYESYLVSSLQQLLGQSPADGFGPEITGGDRRRAAHDLPVAGNGQQHDGRGHVGGLVGDQGREAEHAAVRRHPVPGAGDRRPAQHRLAEPAHVPAGGAVPGTPGPLGVSDPSARLRT